jgi:hypothetical protein
MTQHTITHDFTDPITLRDLPRLIRETREPRRSWWGRLVEWVREPLTTWRIWRSGRL